MKIERLSPPPPGHRVQGWCLYRNDRWDGECPQQEDELGFVVQTVCQNSFRKSGSFFSFRSMLASLVVVSKPAGISAPCVAPRSWSPLHSLLAPWYRRIRRGRFTNGILANSLRGQRLGLRFPGLRTAAPPRTLRGWKMARCGARDRRVADGGEAG